MELDLGLRISRAIENLTFSSTETETVFVLLAHLPGFKKDEIEISINETGTQISISGEGERSSIETTISRRLMLATEVIERFQKVFGIPNSVALDRIDAGFDEENAVLIVLMPKLIQGDVSGVEIEEIKQGEDQEEEGEEASLEQDKQEEGGVTSKEEEQEEKGKDKEASITEDEQEEKGKDDEVSMKEKEQEVKGEGEEASLKEQQEKESSSERNHEDQEFHKFYEPETDQNGEPELEKEQMGMEEKIPKEEIEEEREPRVVPHDLDEEPPSSEAPEPKEAEHEKELQIPMAPPTPPVPVETHDLDEEPPSSEASEPKKAEHDKELQIPRAHPRQEPEQEDELPPEELPTTETPKMDRATDRSEEQRARDGVILGDEAPDRPLETKTLDSAEKDQDLGLGEEVGVEKREGNGNGNGNGSEKKGRKKGKGKGLSLPLSPLLASSAFIVSLAILAFHFLRSRKRTS